MKLKFRINTLMLVLSYYFLFATFPHFTYYNLLKYICMIVVGLYILSNVRILKKKEFMTINIALLALSVVVLYTSWVNRGVIKTRDPFLAAIVFLGVLTEFFLLMEITAVKGNVESMVNVYYVLAATITIVTDVLAITGIQLGGHDGAKYLIGTKFQLVYSHYWLIALYLAKYSSHKLNHKKHKTTLALLLGLTLGMSIFADCTTGIIGAFMIAIMLLMYGRYPDVLYNPLVFVVVLVASFALSFVIDFVLSWPTVEYVITQLLHKDISLSSRTKIFLMVPLLLQGHYLLGYGYGTTYELGRRLGGFPNTQNALWEWIWQCGVLGTTLLIFLIYFVVRYANKSHKLSNDKNSKYLLILLYLFSLLATVEITVNGSYLGYLAMLIPLTYSREKSGKTG